MDKSGVIIGEKPVVTMDVVDGKIRLVWKTSHLTRTLDIELTNVWDVVFVFHVPGKRFHLDLCKKQPLEK